MADTIETLQCPACQEEMVKIFLPESGINIDICLKGCGGIFFDNREFNAVNEKSNDIEPILEAIKEKKFIAVDDTAERNCPVCGAVMHKNYSSIKQEILVDDCYSCGGKFLDNGELQKIKAEYATNEERVADAIKFIYEKEGATLEALDARVARNKNRASFLKRIVDKMFS